MLKAMMFIDGSWLDNAVKTLCEVSARLYIEMVNFEEIWSAVTSHIAQACGFEVDLVRCYCVAGYPDPDTVGPKSKGEAIIIAEGWGKLRSVPRMSLDLFPYHYGKKEFPKYRDEQKAEDSRKEKCVDVDLATRMLYFAAVPGAYDIAILLTGDQDYVPVLRAVRDLGKRTVFATCPSLSGCSTLLKSDNALGDLWDIPLVDLTPVLKRQIANPSMKRGR